MKYRETPGSEQGSPGGSFGRHETPNTTRPIESEALEYIIEICKICEIHICITCIWQTHEVKSTYPIANIACALVGFHKEHFRCEPLYGVNARGIFNSYWYRLLYFSLFNCATCNKRTEQN